jgi:hypothetical protein
MTVDELRHECLLLVEQLQPDEFANLIDKFESISDLIIQIQTADENLLKYYYQDLTMTIDMRTISKEEAQIKCLENKEFEFLLYYVQKHYLRIIQRYGEYYFINDYELSSPPLPSEIQLSQYVRSRYFKSLPFYKRWYEKYIKKSVLHEKRYYVKKY